MYKAIIIDDDPLIRKGLKTIINWNALGFSVMGSAKDGVDGLALIEKIHPDLIVTDIKMPNMDGLEMIRQLRELTDSHIIIVTAFRNFEYAKQALHLGVHDLLLKPTKMDELTNSVTKAREHLDENARLREELQYHEKLFRENIPILKEKFLHDLCLGIEQPGGSEEERLSLFQLHLQQYYILIIRYSMDADKRNITSYLRQIGIIRLCEQVFAPEYTVHSVLSRYAQSAILLSVNENSRKGDDDAVDVAQIRHMAEELIVTAKKSIDLEITVALSSRGYGVEQLNSKYQEGILALEKEFFTGNQVVLEYVGNQEQSAADQESVPHGTENLLVSVRGGNRRGLDEWFEQFLSYAREGKFSVYTCKTICGELFWKLMKLAPEDRGSGEVNLSSIRKIFNSTNFNEITQVLYEFAVRIITQYEEKEISSQNEMINRCKHYVSRHYMDDISLTKAADHIAISPSYLSRIFKKSENQSFNEYLNSIRIQHAISLLTSTTLKSYQIAEKVGFHDPHYFSRLFKKITGKRPSDYRQELRSSE